jgi:DNA-binding response OmpR family regulator
MTSVLVVEDESDVLEIVQDALQRRGLDVRTARTDRDAYSLLDGEARSFGLLIADINLGEGVTGFDVARHARLLNPDLKVVYITGHAAHLDRFGVPDSVMFPKPFYPDELAEQVYGMLNGDADDDGARAP